MLKAEFRTITTVEWPVPVARWQSWQAHMNMDSTGPSIRTLVRPQAQEAEIERMCCAGWLTV